MSPMEVPMLDYVLLALGTLLFGGALGTLAVLLAFRLNK